MCGDSRMEITKSFLSREYRNLDIHFNELFWGLNEVIDYTDKKQVKALQAMNKHYEKMEKAMNVFKSKYVMENCNNGMVF